MRILPSQGIDVGATPAGAISQALLEG